MRPMMLIGVLAVAACGGNGKGDNAASAASEGAVAPARPGAAAAPAKPAALAWSLRSSASGEALVVSGEGDRVAMRLFCPAGEGRLLVNVQAFQPVGSEERLSFGSGGEVVALVADPRGDPGRGGVSGVGPVPANLAALLAGPTSASYGAQRSGPHPAPPPELARGFATACRPASAPAAPARAAAAATGPCHTQDGKNVNGAPLRAVGTEPFWGARIEGRCVTYSNPEDQKGTRVWTRFTPAQGGGTWSGALGGRRFELRIRPERGCSDGMSDKSYPLAAELFVGGEKRSGCAEPL